MKLGTAKAVRAYHVVGANGSDDRGSDYREKCMDWLAENWVWLLVGAAFIAMHMFGHGGHGGHGRHDGRGGSSEGGDKG